jgi:hypothetical protein
MTGGAATIQILLLSFSSASGALTGGPLASFMNLRRDRLPLRF